MKRANYAISIDNVGIQISADVGPGGLRELRHVLELLQPIADLRDQLRTEDAPGGGDTGPANPPPTNSDDAIVEAEAPTSDDRSGEGVPSSLPDPAPVDPYFSSIAVLDTTGAEVDTLQAEIDALMSEPDYRDPEQDTDIVIPISEPETPVGSARERIATSLLTHLDLSPKERAELVGMPKGTVTGYLAILRKETAEEAHGTEVGNPTTEPEADTFEAEAEAIHEAVMTPPDVPEPLPIRGYPKSQSKTKFWLKNADGEYLNMFCSGFTKDHRRAWQGTEAQLLNCRRSFIIAADLREEVVRPITGAV